AALSSAASCQDSARALTRWNAGPSKGSNPQYPFSAPLTVLPRVVVPTPEVSTTKPPCSASALAGRSIVLPSLPVRLRRMSCAYPVENTSGAPSTGSTRELLRAQKISFGSTACSGGGCGASIAGSAVTSTDFGSWKDGGVLSVSARTSPCCVASAGMYW